MRFLLHRGKRPAERLRLSIDFARDVAKIVGDSAAAIAVKAFDQAGADITAAQVEGVTRDGTIGYCWFKPIAAGTKTTHEVNFILTTTMGAIYEHGIAVNIDPLA